MSINIDSYFPVRVTTITERNAQPTVEGLRCFVSDTMSEYVYTGGQWVLVVTAISSTTQTALDAKQATLVSATNIKTINGDSVLGSGDLTVSGSGADWGDIGGTLANQTDLQTALDAKVADAINNGTTTIAPSQNAVFDALALKAPLASPTFTGTVTLPVATTYVHVSVSSGATTTGANTTPVDVSGAVFTYVNNAVYRIWVMGRVNATAATTGLGIQFNLSTAITDINVYTVHPLTTSTPGGAYSISDDTSEGVTTGVPAGPLDVPFVTNALFRPGNNTGTCQLRFRSETTAVTELLAGVTMVVERLV